MSLNKISVNTIDAGFNGTELSLLSDGIFVRDIDLTKYLYNNSRYVNINGEVITTDKNWCCTGNIPCIEGSVFECSFYCHSLVSAVSVYGKSNTLLSTWSPLELPEGTEPREEFLTFTKEITESNASYVVFSTGSKKYVEEEVYSQYNIAGKTIVNIYDYLESPVFEGLFISNTLSFSDQFKNIGFIRTDGVTVAVDNNWRYSNLIIVQ